MMWTDGACSQQNGTGHGPGGWGVVLEYGGKQKTLFGSELDTTNQRMELLAAIEGLKALKKPCRVKLYSDSAYLVEAMTRGWIQRCRMSGWKNSKKKPVANVALWEILEEVSKPHDIEWIKVKGHDENAGNNKADALAYAAAQGAKWREVAAR